jgi:RNA polymerase sigma-70 factor (ECF subfamily)
MIWLLMRSCRPACGKFRQARCCWQWPDDKALGIGRKSAQLAAMPNTIAAIEACIPALRRYARALLRHNQDADDLVQETLLRAIEGLRSRRRDAEVRPWLFTIMHNQFVSHLRRAKVRREDAQREYPERQANAPNAEFARGRQEDGLHWQDFIRAFDAIPEDQRTVLLLVSVEDLSYAEVSQVLDIPIGTVMSRLARGRERLRALTAADEGKPVLRRVK